MTFQPLIPTVLTPVAVSVLPDPAAAILAVAEALQPDLARGFQIDALRLRLEMERAFGGTDAMGAWDWKLAYEAGEVALVLFLRKFGRALLARAGSPAALLPILAKVAARSPLAVHHQHNTYSVTHTTFLTSPIAFPTMRIAQFFYLNSHRFNPNADCGYQKPARANLIAQVVSL